MHWLIAHNYNDPEEIEYTAVYVQLYVRKFINFVIKYPVQVFFL